MLRFRKISTTREFYFSLYYFLYALIKILTVSSGNFRTIILFTTVIVICLLSYIKGVRINQSIFNYIIFIFMMILLQLLNFNGSNLNYYMRYGLDFVLYGILPSVLLFQCKDYQDIVKSMFWMSTMNILINAWDPFLKYKYFTDQMGYGFSVILPSYIALDMGNRIYKKKWANYLKYFTLLLLIIFANRSSYISVFFYILIVKIYEAKETKSYKQLFSVIAIILAGFFVIVNAKSIISLLYNFVKSCGYYSYALRHMMYFVEGDTNMFFSGRIDIWKNAWDMFLKSPIIGHGIGGFESIYRKYVHNVVLDILVSNGVIGLLFFTCMLMYACKRILRGTRECKMLGIQFFCTAFPKLFFSITIWQEPSFWCLIALGIMAKPIQYGTIDEGYQLHSSV